MLYAKKGNKMQCSQCDTILYDFTRDVYAGDSIEASQLKAVKGIPEPVDGEKSDCPNCGNNLIVGGHNVVE